MKLKVVEQYVPHNEVVWHILKETSWATRIGLADPVYFLARDGERLERDYITINGAKSDLRRILSEERVQVPYYLLPVRMQRYLLYSGRYFNWSGLQRDDMLDLIRYGWVEPAGGNFRKVDEK